MSKVTPVQIIEAFLNGEEHMYCDTTGLNEKICICGNKIMYYNDVACERIEDKYHIYCSDFSIHRKEFDRLLLKMIPENKQV